MSDDLLREVLKIQREKAAVKVANITAPLKASLLAQLDAKLKTLEDSMVVGSGHVSNVKPK